MKKLFPLLAFTLFFSNAMFAQSATTDVELPAIKAANANAFFIPAVVCTKFKVTEAKGDAWMKVYNNLDENAKLQRVNDIRWEAADKAGALAWYNSHIPLLSENAEDVTATFDKPVGVAAFNVYQASAATKKMMESFGMKQNQYTFIFVVDKYVAKIFVGVNEATSLKESWNFVKEGLIATLKASGNPKMASLVL